MRFHFFSRDFVIRSFVIIVASLILLLFTQNQSFDLHFKIRKAQSTSKNVIIIEIPARIEPAEAFATLDQGGAQLIVTHKSLLPQVGGKVLAYATLEPDTQSMNVNLTPDGDGLVRAAEVLSVPEDSPVNFPTRRPLTINFRGPPGTFNTFNFYDLQENIGLLKDKTLIVRREVPLRSYTTPVGLMAEAEVLATLFDNMYENRFIPEKNLWLASLVLILILVITSLFLIYLPSTLGLVSTVGFALLYVSLSLWVFDTLTLWTPILVPSVQMFFTLILVANYKSILNEKTKWELEKDTLYFNEIEEMKTNFLSLFSHDLKTPLAKIIGIADTLASKSQDPELKKELEKIQLSSRDLEKYIKRILKMSQVQSKNIAVNKAPQDINNLIEKSVSQNKLSAQEKNIILETDLAPLFLVEMDGPLVQEVIVNFIENAITYSPEGSRIKVTSTEVDNYIKVTVTDQGKGIPKEVQDSIWERYYRFDKEQSGYGIGLFLCRYVITLHGGQVFVHSKENVGSEFGFVLPLNED